MELITAIIVTILTIIFSGLFSGTEIAYVQSNKVRMEIDASRGGFINHILQRFKSHEEMFLSTLLVGNNVVLVVYGIAFSTIVVTLFKGWMPDNDALMLVCNTVLSTIIILITGEFLPKTVFRINPNSMMRLLALPMFLIYIILYPVSLLASGLSRGLMWIFGISAGPQSSNLLTMEQLDDYIRETLEKPENKVVENEVKIFRNAIDFKDTQIDECMIPRNEMVAVNIDNTTREDLLQLFIATGLSKIVVFRDDIDNVLGYIHISELFNPEADWRSHLKPVIFTPETMLADKMMRRLLAEKRSMAIIVDEFGGTAGLVTLEDLVEEIFGEIEDEHDRKRQLARRLPDGTFEFAGRAEIEQINSEFGLNIPEDEDYHTLAGFILERTGALPVQDDVIVIDGWKFTILRMSDTRIELVEVAPAEETA